MLHSSNFLRSHDAVEFAKKLAGESFRMSQIFIWKYARLMQHFIEESTPWMEHLSEKACGPCKGACCVRRNYIHKADVLRFHYSEILDKLPEFPDEYDVSKKCIYYGKLGCGLKRKYRPIICVEFMCVSLVESVKNDQPYKQLTDTCNILRIAIEQLCNMYDSEQKLKKSKTSEKYLLHFEKYFHECSRRFDGGKNENKGIQSLERELPYAG